MARITKKKFININPSDIGKMRAPELRSLLRGARALFNAQAKQFDKYSNKVWSPALDKMEKFYEDRGSISPSRMNINQMRSELFHLQDFFQAETSTVPGARKIQKQQDIRLFGSDSRGRPKKRMTVEQRTNFWSLFEEYKKMRPADVFEQSNMVQQQLAQMLIEKGNLDFSAKSINELAARIDDERNRFNWEMDEEYDDESVFSGTRPY